MQKQAKTCRFLADSWSLSKYIICGLTFRSISLILIARLGQNKKSKQKQNKEKNKYVEETICN